MVDHETVCCMCGDVGFADKIFQCCRCHFRFQHSYCSNYYYGNESSTTTKELCDWCLSEGRNSSSTSSVNKHHHGVSSSKRSSSSSSSSMNIHVRSEYTSRERIKQHNQDHTANNTTTTSTAERGTNTTASKSSGIPSPRTGTHRRYKLLKDVMC